MLSKWKCFVGAAILAAFLSIGSTVAVNAASHEEMKALPNIQEADIDTFRNIINHYDDQDFGPYVYNPDNSEYERDWQLNTAQRVVSDQLENLFEKYLFSNPDFKYFPVTQKSIKRFMKDTDVILTSNMPSDSVNFYAFVSGPWDDGYCLIVFPGKHFDPDVRQDMSFWIHAFFHEFAHRLGFNEGMATFFSTKMTGSTQLNNDYDMNYIGYENIYADLYDALKANGETYAFWPAAFQVGWGDKTLPFKKFFGPNKEIQALTFEEFSITIDDLTQIYDKESTLLSDPNISYDNYYAILKVEQQAAELFHDVMCHPRNKKLAQDNMRQVKTILDRI